MKLSNGQPIGHFVRGNSGTGFPGLALRVRGPVPRPCPTRPLSVRCEAWQYILLRDLQAKIDQLVRETGCTPNQLIEDALAGYLPEMSELRETLSSRYRNVVLWLR
jgi:hypothetical protein